MIILLPKKGTALIKMLKTLADTKIDELLNLLEKAEKEFLDEEVQVYLPKFKVHSDFVLNGVLDKVSIFLFCLLV